MKIIIKRGVLMRDCFKSYYAVYFTYYAVCIM